MLTTLAVGALALALACQGNAPPLAEAKPAAHGATTTEAHQPAHAAVAAKPRASRSAPLLGPSRQLTFSGRRTGEGYFSADGRRLVFQSEREPGNPFYQIYLMEIESGAVQRISPGVGKTTCAWIHPGGDRVLFASTHLDPAARRSFLERLSGIGGLIAQASRGIRDLCYLGWYQDPRTWGPLGYGGPLVSSETPRPPIYAELVAEPGVPPGFSR